MTDREAFEEWALKTICNNDDLQRKEVTGYGSQELNYLWRGWQASRKQALEDAAKLHRWMLSEYDWVSSDQTKKESFDEFKVRMK